MEKRLVPLDDLIDIDVPDIRRQNEVYVGFHGRFPPSVPVKRIGVDINRVQRLCELNGIWRWRIALDTDGDVSETTVMMGGMSSQGEAYATKGGSKKIAPLETRSFQPILVQRLQPFPFTWAEAVTELNLNEMTTRIAHDEKFRRDVRSAAAWSNYLNTALRGSLSSIGSEFLRTGMNPVQTDRAWFFYSLGLGAGAISELINILGKGQSLDIFNFLSHVYGYAAAANAIDALYWKSFLNNVGNVVRSMEVLENRPMGRVPAVLKKFRPSLTLANQYDRAFISKLVMSRVRLVEEIK